MNKLEALKAMTDVVADTGDVSAIREFAPQDATTNPSLLLKAAVLPEYAELVSEAKRWANAQGGSSQQLLSNCCDKLAVAIGTEILQVIPGRVSSEVDARLSFDTQATVARGSPVISLYQ